MKGRSNFGVYTRDYIVRECRCEDEYFWLTCKFEVKEVYT